ncbi:efflux RND transporter periplasmic adaptor subunit [bacterium]|nr:efflux RND transporter periplasmic adaptor subunit [bacterium]
MKIKFLCLIIFLGLIGFAFSENDHESQEGHEQKTEEHKDHEGNGEHEEDLKFTDKIVQELGITAKPAIRKNIGEMISAKGKIVTKPNNFAKVGSLISGRIAKIHSKLGDSVQKGEVLFEIESTEIIKSISDYITAKSEFAVAKASFERLENLRKSQIGSEKDFLQSKAEFEIALANLKGADLIIHTIGFTDDDLDEIFESEMHTKVLFKIRAPISGEISFSEIKLGQNISEDVTVFEITDFSKIWVEISLFEKDFPKVKAGNKVEVKLSTQNSIFSGKILRIGKTLSERDRTIPLIAEIESPEHFLINSFVEVEIFSNEKSTLAVQDKAIHFDGKEYFIFVEEEHNTFERREVFVGRKFENYTEIVSGLEENEKVVVEGSFYLKSRLASENIGGHNH